MSEILKVRIGYGLGTRTNLHDESYGVVVDALEAAARVEAEEAHLPRAVEADHAISELHGAATCSLRCNWRGRRRRLDNGLELLQRVGQ